MSNLKFEDLEKAVVEWAWQRNIMWKSNWQAQMAKTIEEVGELSRACQKGNHDEMVDAVGDVLVSLILLKEMSVNRQLVSGDDGYLSATECLEVAYNTIASRTGRMVGGIFVKD